jgi:hypothetical protein
MLAVTKPETRYFDFHSTGNDLTTVQLKNRKDGRLVNVKIWSRIPLSLTEVREAVSAALNESHWQWQWLDISSEYVPF